jgi:hypothetical protein
MVQLTGRRLPRHGFSWIWPVITLVVGAAVAVRAEIALPSLGGALLLACSVLLPRTTVGLAVLTMLSVRTITHLTGVEAVGYLDEAVVALCVVVLPLRRLAMGRTPRGLPGQSWFALFAVLGLIGGIVAGMPLSQLLIAAFVTCKGVLLGWAIAQVDWAPHDLRLAARAGAALIVVCLLAVLANLVAPHAWAALLGNRGNLDYRASIPSLIGPFVHPLDLGQVMAAATIALVAWRAVIGKRPLSFVLLIGTGAAALLSFRRTAITAVLVGVLWVRAQRGAARVVLTAALVLSIAAIALYVPLSQVVSRTYDDYLVAGGTEARTVLAIGSLDVAVHHFPLGAGFGRFGSQIAATSYSPEYVTRGYPAIWGLGPTEQTGRFLTDTEWPAILGETGLIGGVAFAIGLLAIYRRGRTAWTAGRLPLVRWAGLVAMGWVVSFAVVSVAAVVFTGPPSYGLLFGLAGMLAALSDPDGVRHGARHRGRSAERAIHARSAAPGWPPRSARPHGPWRRRRAPRRRQDPTAVR